MTNLPRTEMILLLHWMESLQITTPNRYCLYSFHQQLWR